MGTTAPSNDEKVHGVIQYADKTITVVTDMAYGHNRGSIYPLILVVVAIVAVALLLLVEGWVYGLVALLSLGLLGVWVGGNGR